MAVSWDDTTGRLSSAERRRVDARSASQKERRLAEGDRELAELVADAAERLELDGDRVLELEDELAPFGDYDPRSNYGTW